MTAATPPATRTGHRVRNPRLPPVQPRHRPLPVNGPLLEPTNPQSLNAYDIADNPTTRSDSTGKSPALACPGDTLGAVQARTAQSSGAGTPASPTRPARGQHLQPRRPQAQGGHKHKAATGQEGSTEVDSEALRRWYVGVYVGGSACVVLAGGKPGATVSVAGGSGWPTQAGASVGVLFSNASDVHQLAGPFGFAQIGGSGGGRSVGAEFALGQDSNNNMNWINQITLSVLIYGWKPVLFPRWWSDTLAWGP